MVTGRPPSIVAPSSQRCASLASHSRASASERVAFPAKFAGRSKGVRVALDQMPVRSGCPSAARGTAPALGAAGGAAALCAETDATAKRETALDLIRLRNVMAHPSASDYIAARL